jgi:DNA (cytosine-5)-methyltransferase 1
MMDGLIVDNFAGGGGASDGIEAAFGRPVDVAINHDNEAIAMHKANHPQTLHICQSVWKADPLEVVQGRQVALGWFSPDCKHFSKAKGGKPVEKGIRDLAWVVVHWVRRLGPDLQPRVIMLENVEEFRTWCPIDPETGLPMKVRRANGQMSLLEDPPVLRKGKRKVIKPEGETFQLWVAALEKAGYAIEWKELRGCDYGAPTIRKRLFVIARCDGRPIVWPEPTHGPGRAQPWRTAAEIIDWSLPCPSIFDRKKPLAENTLRRIAHGIMKFVVNSASPFIVPVTNSTWAANRTIDIGKALPTVTTAKGGEMALVTPYIVGAGGAAYAGKPRDAGEPLGAATVHDRKALIAPTLIQTGYGERPGQAPRVPGLHKPLGTAVSGAAKAAVVSAFLAKHTTGGIGRDLRGPASTVTANGAPEKRQGGATPLGIVCAHIEQANGGPNNDHLAGRPVGAPMSTATATGSQQRLVATHLTKFYGSAKHGQASDEPLATPTTGGGRGGGHAGQVCAFLAKYFGSAQHGQDVDESLHTISTKPRFGLVTVTIAGEEWVIVDIGMRMLTPRELARAQGFNDNYILDPVCDRVLPSGKKKRGRLPIASQIRMIGNSVNRDVAEALVAANCNAPLEKALEVQAA